MAHYGMVIDLNKCVGCSECQIACKIENTVGEGQFFSYHETVTKGEFPNVKYRYIPVMCNHCTDAPCVKVCPVHAMQKKDGLTFLDQTKCVGCARCNHACPYKRVKLRSMDFLKRQLSEKALVAGGTASGMEIAEKTDVPVAWGNYDAVSEEILMKAATSAKCNACPQRREKGEDPYCVHMCPAKARVFGDIDDPESEIAKLLKENKTSVSHPKFKTKPSVFYIG